ncbi:MAG: peptidyl-tRNA hydrolase Pth2 [Candidatus Anstonellaceae archaeon]
MAIKQAIVVRMDLKMGRGKLAAQVAHASVLAYLKASKQNPSVCAKWIEEGQKKVVLKVKGEEELLGLYEKMKRQVPCEIVRDAGHTQLEPGTITCFGAGPEEEEKIDAYLKGLKLL